MVTLPGVGGGVEGMKASHHLSLQITHQSTHLLAAWFTLYSLYLKSTPKSWVAVSERKKGGELDDKKWVWECEQGARFSVP